MGIVPTVRQDYTLFHRLQEMEKQSKKGLKERIKFLKEEQEKEHSLYRKKNIEKLKEELKEFNGKKKKEHAIIIEFLTQSNAIENEFSKEALEDSLKAWNWGLKQKKNDLKLILGVHKRIMKRLNPRIAGKIRAVDVWVGNRKCLNPEFIKGELDLLCNPGVYPILNEEFIKTWHVRFEKIHFAEDGNGRTGRILMNLQRIRAGFPLLIIYNKDKYSYYEWFR